MRSARTAGGPSRHDDDPVRWRPGAFGGPDTNTTAEAVEGLAAQGTLSPAAASNAAAFIKNAQNADGGWAIEPNAPDNQQASDPDSTALVIQAILALGLAPDGAPVRHRWAHADGVAVVLPDHLGCRCRRLLVLCARDR